MAYTTLRKHLAASWVCCTPFHSLLGGYLLNPELRDNFWTIVLWQITNLWTLNQCVIPQVVSHTQLQVNNKRKNMPNHLLCNHAWE